MLLHQKKNMKITGKSWHFRILLFLLLLAHKVVSGSPTLWWYLIISFKKICLCPKHQKEKWGAFIFTICLIISFGTLHLLDLLAFLLQKLISSTSIVLFVFSLKGHTYAFHDWVVDLFLLFFKCFYPMGYSSAS